MKRYYLTPDASEDLDDIRRYLDHIPEQHAAPIRRGLRRLLSDVASHPERGASHSAATRILGQEIRARLVPPYRVFYRDNKGTPEVLGILHMARDIETVLTRRVQ